jgi:hypothetical protein
MKKSPKNKAWFVSEFSGCPEVDEPDISFHQEVEKRRKSMEKTPETPFDQNLSEKFNNIVNSMTLKDTELISGINLVNTEEVSTVTFQLSLNQDSLKNVKSEWMESSSDDGSDFEVENPKEIRNFESEKNVKPEDKSFLT